MDWRHRAACLSEDPELFFPIGNTGPALARSRRRRRSVPGARFAPSAWPGLWKPARTRCVGRHERGREARYQTSSVPLPRASFLTCSQFSARRWSQPLERDYEPGTGSDPVGVVLEGERATEVLHQGRHD